MSDKPRLILVQAAQALAGEQDLDEMLEVIAGAARQLVGARYAALGVIGQDDRLEQFVHLGMDADEIRAVGALPTGRGILGLLIRDPHVIRLENIAEHPASVGFPDHHPPMHSFIGAPVRMSGRVYGNLYLTEKEGGFTEEDESWLEIFAAQAGAAIENALLSHRLREVAVRSERDRISRDLHDGIIQSLFSIGMTLESAGSLVTTSPERTAERISMAVDSIDATIRELRNTIFDLRPHDSAALGIRDGLVELAREHEVNALVRPTLTLGKDLDAVVPAAVIPDVLQIVRESLMNVARHAGDATVAIEAQVRDGHLEVVVTDDGVGFTPTAPAVGRGLENINERAEVLDAALTIDSAPGDGTRLHLRVPLPDVPPLPEETS